MKLRKIEFFTNDEGAVTVDWVVLTAAVVVLASLAATPYIESAARVGGNIPNAIN